MMKQFLAAFTTALYLVAVYTAGATESLAWDSPSKQVKPDTGDVAAHFTFTVTNVSPDEIIIQTVTTSCGCTVAQLPSQPWRLAPGDHGDLKFTMDLRGKSGTLNKSATVHTSVGDKVLAMQVMLPAPAPAAAASSPGPVAPGGTSATSGGERGERARNQEAARADHQAVFRGDCARCHAEPAKGKLGRELYASVCGICHDAEHRATMVPALGKSALAGDPAYWRTWITFGKPGSFMPGFSKPVGGPLDREQVESLAAYLATNHPVAAAH